MAADEVQVEPEEVSAELDHLTGQLDWVAARLAELDAAAAAAVAPTLPAQQLPPSG